MRLNRRMDYEFDVVISGAGATSIVTVPRCDGYPGLRSTKVLSLSHDRAVVATPGALKYDLQVKIVPQKQNDIFGGDMYHTFGARPARGGETAANHVNLGGADIRPTEEIKMTFTAGQAGTWRVCLEREGIYDPQTPVDFFGQS